ncbi:coiled-coil domain-containing protein 32 [Gastrophryne carolinensis]
MRMLEGLDGGSPVSSQEMWAEICPCAPVTPELSPQETFSDSFLGPFSKDGDTCKAESDFQNPTQRPWAPLHDSDAYLASLERRLQKIKGQNKEVTSKDMLRSLGQAKKECLDRLLQETFEPDAYVDTSDVDSNTLEHLKRWLQPEKVALNAEEVQRLIPGDAPPTNDENEEEAAAEH